MTRFHVRHTTTYEYQDAVNTSYHSAHLVPRALSDQVLENTTCHITPAPDSHYYGDDYYGNRRDDFHILSPHTTLEVCVESMVTIAQRPFPNAYDESLAIPWEEWAAHCGALQHWPLQDFLSPSPLIPHSIELQRWAQSIFTPGKGLWAAILELNQCIFDQFTYAPGVTDVHTPLAQVLTTHEGVCQDFAHIMVGALRAMGLPSRYVSGYLETLPAPGQEKRLLGADASHAWASVYIPQHGWVDVDPTNNLVVTDQYVVVAWGRDYSDVTPLKGIIQGGGEHRLQVAVDVSRQQPSSPQPSSPQPSSP